MEGYGLYLLAVALIAAGAVGTVVPALPGIPLICAGGWLIAWASDYRLIGVSVVVMLVTLTCLGIGIDLLAQVFGAKRAGASKAGLLGAVIGVVAGIFTGFWGIIILPLLGAVAGELLAGRSLGRAGLVGAATWLGMAVGTGLKIAIALVMIVLIISRVAGNIDYVLPLELAPYVGKGASEGAAPASPGVPASPAANL